MPSRSLRFLKKIVIEIFCCLYIFSLQCRTSTFQNLLKDKSCQNELKSNITVCDNLSNFEAIENEVQRMTTAYNMYYSLIGTFPSIVTTIYLGSWSDIYGRKVPIVIAVVGSLVEILGIILNSIYFDAPLLYMLLPAIPGGCFGGSMVILTSCYSYISNISHSENRALRFNFINIAYTFAGPLGIAIGGVIFKFRGSTAVFVTSFAVLGLGLIVILLWFRENSPEQIMAPKVNTCRSLFSLDHLKDNIKTCCRERTNYTRLEIWLVFVTNFLVNMSFMGTITVQFMFALKMYSWDNYNYSLITMIISVIQGTAVLISIPVLSKILKIHDAVLAIIGAISLASQELIRAFARNEWMYYLAATTGLLGAQTGIAVRSRLSKLVLNEEIGKIFSVLALFESIPPLFGPVVFTLIYNASLDFFPGLAYVTSATCLIIPITFYIWVYVFARTAPYGNEDYVYQEISEANFIGTDDLSQD